MSPCRLCLQCIQLDSKATVCIVVSLCSFSTSLGCFSLSLPIKKKSKLIICCPLSLCDQNKWASSLLAPPSLLRTALLFSVRLHDHVDTGPKPFGPEVQVPESRTSYCICNRHRKTLQDLTATIKACPVIVSLETTSAQEDTHLSHTHTYIYTRPQRQLNMIS